MLVLATLTVGTMAGLLARRAAVPGGVVVGALLGSAAVTLLSGADSELPGPLTLAIPVSIGVMTGVSIAAGRRSPLRRVLVPAVMSAAGLIATGVAVAFLLAQTVLDERTAALATSPGALSLAVGTAVDAGANEVRVAFFHTVRLVLVLVATPLILGWLQRRPGRPQ